MINTRNLRIALYSHDTMGLGHTRRNLLIARTFACALPHADVLMITGARESSSFALPPSVDCLTLPSLHKGLDGTYQARSLKLTLGHMIALRTSIIKAALDSFKPDVLIVDNVPRGAVRELDPILPELQGRTRCVLGLRDVLDDPTAVRAEWRRLGNEEAIRDLYQAVWIYGDPEVYDPVREYGFSPDLEAKVRYAGYFDRCGSRAEAPAEPFALCLVGGGQDGARLAQTFAEALPPGMSGVVLTGPYMPQEAKERLRQRAFQSPRLKVLDFVPEATVLIRAAERVITMGGYNTVSEVLCYEKPTLLVPRVLPRREQLVRAERLHELGLADFLHPDALSPDALGDWLKRPIVSPSARHRIDFGGLARLPELLEEVLDSVPVISSPERYPLYAG